MKMDPITISNEKMNKNTQKINQQASNPLRKKAQSEKKDGK